MSTNDDIEKINESFNELHEVKEPSISPNLNISHELPDKEKEKIAKYKELADALGVTQQQEDMDKMQQSMQFLAGEAEKTNQAVNQIGEFIKNGGVQAPQSQPQQGGGMDLEKAEIVGTLLEKAMGIYSQFKGTNNPPQTSLISNEEIQKRMVESFYDDLDTGKNIRGFITNALKKNATRQIINTSLKDIGSPDVSEVNHGP